jgi:pyrophosphatase PpaX
MRTRGVMFDWDGVLLDSLGASFNVYNKIFARLGVRQLTKNEFLEYQSPNWYDFYRRVKLPKRYWKEADADWLRFYSEERPALHPDAIGCLAQLKGRGFALALVSNGSKERVLEELQRFGVEPFFEAIEFGVKRAELKPSPYMLEKALVELELQPSEAVYVGDSPADIQAAKNASIPSIALARGPIQARRLSAEKPDFIFRRLDEMTNSLVRGLVVTS